MVDTNFIVKPEKFNKKINISFLFMTVNFIIIINGNGNRSGNRNGGSKKLRGDSYRTDSKR